MREERFWCWRITLIVPESDGYEVGDINYGVREQQLWCERVTLKVLEDNGYCAGE
jgi:hypothetical protein